MNVRSANALVLGLAQWPIEVESLGVVIVITEEGGFADTKWDNGLVF